MEVVCYIATIAHTKSCDCVTTPVVKSLESMFNSGSGGCPLEQRCDDVAASPVFLSLRFLPADAFRIYGVPA